MKTNTDYEIALMLIDKLETALKYHQDCCPPITMTEMQLILDILTAVQGDYIPTETEFKEQKYRIKELDRENLSHEEYALILEKCSEYENKYC